MMTPVTLPKTPDNRLRAERRHAAIQRTIAQVRALAVNPTPTHTQRLGLSHVMAALAARADLWPDDDFPIAPGERWAAHRLHEDEDGSHALYAVPMRPGHAQPPHDHTTWAVIAGVRGSERNVLFDAPPDRGVAVAVAQRLVPLREVAIDAGRTLVLGPTEIHAIDVPGPGNAFHLHLYGRGLGHLQQRSRYDLATGAAQPFVV